MTTFLSKELHDDLTRAQKDKKVKKSRLRVEFDGALVTVLKLWDNGFSMDIEHAPQLRGLVDIFDGSRHLSQCLIIASTEESGEIHLGNGSSEEPLVLGDTLVELLKDLCTELQAMTHPTPAGPSGPPVNAPKFAAIASKLNTILSKKNFVD